MWLILGLGNPGRGYAGNRHNVGFMAVEAIARAHRFPAFSQKFNAQVADGSVAGTRALLACPQSFMNLSGQSAGEIARFYKIPAERTLVIHDELDLPAAKLRVKRGGGNGGHNGLKSLDAHLDSPEYLRIRIGIGHPGERDLVSPYVLSDFPKAEHPALARLLGAVAAHLPLLLAGDEAGFMNKVTLEQQSG